MDNLTLNAAEERIKKAFETASEMAKDPRAPLLAKAIETRSLAFAKEAVEAAGETETEALTNKVFDLLDSANVNNATVLCALAAIASDIILGNADADGSDHGLLVTIRQNAYNIILKGQLAYKMAIEANEKEAAEAEEATKN